MPHRRAWPGAADALAGGREFEHDIDGRVARIGMITGEDVDGVVAGSSAGDIVGLAAPARFFSGDLARDHDRSGQRIVWLIIGMLIPRSGYTAIGTVCNVASRLLRRGWSAAASLARWKGLRLWKILETWS
jgi:hypothetical protein